jgi:hypothetical protein
MSWVIVNKASGKAEVETWDKDKADWVNNNSKTHRAIPIGDWLASLNQN